jgi:hypothetical protein
MPKHVQTQQNVNPDQTDLYPGQNEARSGTEDDEPIYEQMDGAETGDNRTPKKTQTRSMRHNTEEQTVAYEGAIDTRTPRKPSQGITSHSSDDESERQQKVVNERPDAQAGVNHSKKP